MISTSVTNIQTAVSRNFAVWLTITIGFVVTYYVGLLLSMIWRFGNWPNYITGYDWPGNVWTIIQSTPSWIDMAPIITEEWLLEVGYMNMSFGNGISEWSLNLIPIKMLVIVVLAMIVATMWALFHERERSCTRQAIAPLMATGAGTSLVALTGATMSWVVCCATPSWIVGLAMLGMSVAMANWLEPAGTLVALAGFTLLAVGLLVQARLPLRDTVTGRSTSAASVVPTSLRSAKPPRTRFGKTVSG
ncbi:MAG: hypothetical protein AAFV45_00330 [Pseudomonadota bacterium]